MLFEINTIILASMAALLSALLVLRITEKPIRIGFRVVESAANTFTTVPISIPSVPSVSLGRGKDVKAIGVEVMKFSSNMEQPAMEDDQTNRIIFELVKGAAPTALLGNQNQRVIAQRDIELQNQLTTSGSASTIHERAKIIDLTDGDGNGELILDNEIHAVVQGVGNSASATIVGYILAHLVEFDSKEAIFEMIEATE